MPASTGCIPAGSVFLNDVFTSPVCARACVKAGECASIPTAVCWACWPGPGVTTDTIFWVGTDKCRAEVPAAEERVSGTFMTELGMGAGDWLGKKESDDRGVDNLGKVGATIGALVDEHSACTGIPVANLTVASAEPRTGALVTTGETMAGTLTNLGEDETKVGVPAGDAKPPACRVGNLGRAATTFVLLCNNGDPILLSWTGKTLGVGEGSDGPTAGVHATKGELTAGALGCLVRDCGRMGARGARAT